MGPYLELVLLLMQRQETTSQFYLKTSSVLTAPSTDTRPQHNALFILFPCNLGNCWPFHRSCWAEAGIAPFWMNSRPGGCVQPSPVPLSVHLTHSWVQGCPYKVPLDHVHRGLPNLVRFLISSAIPSWRWAPVPQISGLSGRCPTNELIQIMLKSQIRLKTIQSG